MNIHDIPDLKIRELARSTAVLVGKAVLTDHGAYYTGKTATVVEDINMCADEPFATEPTLGKCSAFLVHEQWIATAAHCVTSLSCLITDIVFDYDTDLAAQVPLQIPSKNVYSCDQVYFPPKVTSNLYALVHLTRPVTDRKPLKLATSMPVKDDAVYVLGNPMNWPTKFSGIARVRSIQDDFAFIDADAFGGNSGSATFNSQNEVFGILTAGGDDDYEYDWNKQCHVLKRCPQDGCNGMEALDIQQVKAGLRKVGAN